MPFDRRRVLLSGAVGLLAPACPKDPPDRGPPPAQDPALTGRAAAVEALTAAAARILPSEGDGPGAAEAGVGLYLAGLLDDPAVSHLHRVLQNGGAFLNRAAKNRGAASYAALSSDDQNDVLQKLLDGKMRPNGFSGPQFVRVLTALCLEGFLCDPARGGNKDKVAWTWLGYDPRGRGAVYD